MARRFHEIVAHFETLPGSGEPYSKPLLVRYTFEYARSVASQDNVLRTFFRSISVPMDGQDAIDYTPSLAADFNDFADSLMNNFFLPLKASGGKTAQPTPKVDSALRQLRAGHLEAGTPDRLSTLRSLCLERDRHRCVITRCFDDDEIAARIEAGDGIAYDDDGVLFSAAWGRTEDLEVAHILPHALTKASSEAHPELDEDKKTTLRILNMFDNGVTSLIDGIDIDQPRNAISLTGRMHKDFGKFKIFFDPVPNAVPGEATYTIGHFLHKVRAQMLGLPVTRTLFHSDTIDPPSPRFLAIHRAVAHILHLSGAGEYIDKVLDDLEKDHIRSDGSTCLGEIVRLRMEELWDGTVCV